MIVLAGVALMGISNTTLVAVEIKEINHAGFCISEIHQLAIG